MPDQTDDAAFTRVIYALNAAHREQTSWSDCRCFLTLCGRKNMQLSHGELPCWLTTACTTAEMRLGLQTVRGMQSALSSVVQLRFCTRCILWRNHFMSVCTIMLQLVTYEWKVLGNFCRFNRNLAPSVGLLCKNTYNPLTTVRRDPLVLERVTVFGGHTSVS